MLAVWVVALVRSRLVWVRSLNDFRVVLAWASFQASGHQRESLERQRNESTAIRSHRVTVYARNRSVTRGHARTAGSDAQSNVLIVWRSQLARTPFDTGEFAHQPAPLALTIRGRYMTRSQSIPITLYSGSKLADGLLFTEEAVF